MEVEITWMNADPTKPYLQLSVNDVDCIIADYPMIYTFGEGREKVCEECYSTCQPQEQAQMFRRPHFHAAVGWHPIIGHQDNLHLFCQLCEKRIATRQPMANCQVCLSFYGANRPRLMRFQMVRHIPRLPGVYYDGQPTGHPQISLRGFHLLCLRQKMDNEVYVTPDRMPPQGEFTPLMCGVCYGDVGGDASEAYPVYTHRLDYHAATAMTPFIILDNVDYKTYDHDPLALTCWMCGIQLVEARWRRECNICRNFKIDGTNEDPYAQYVYRQNDSNNSPHT